MDDVDGHGGGDYTNDHTIYAVHFYLNDSQSKMVYHSNSAPSTDHFSFSFTDNTFNSVYTESTDDGICIELYKSTGCSERVLIGETKIPLSFLLATDEKYLIIEIRRSDDLFTTSLSTVSIDGFNGSGIDNSNNANNNVNNDKSSISILLKLDIRNRDLRKATKRRLSLRRKQKLKETIQQQQQQLSPQLKRSLSLQRKSSLIRRPNPMTESHSNINEALSPSRLKESTMSILNDPLNPTVSTATLTEEPTALFASAITKTSSLLKKTKTSAKGCAKKSYSLPSTRPSSPPTTTTTATDFLIGKLNLLSTPHPLIEDSLPEQASEDEDDDGNSSQLQSPSLPPHERVNASSMLALQSPQIDESILLNPSIIKGLVSLEIVGATNLPTQRRLLRLKDTTNPFCVVGFGKQTFRTKVQRGNQNPFWRERLFFAVKRHEVNYYIRFSIYDHSKLSYNSKIGSNHISLSSLLDSPNQIKKIEVPILGSFTGAAGNVSACGGLANNTSTTNTTKTKTMPNTQSSLLLKACFVSYDELRRNFWELLAQQYDHDDNGKLNRIELTAMLDCIGCTLSEASLDTILLKMEIKPDLVGEIDISTIVEALEVLATSGGGGSGGGGSGCVGGGGSNNHNDNESFFKSGLSENLVHMDYCPICCLNFKKLHFNLDIDIITHMSICAAKDSSKVDRFIMGGFLTENYASMKWFSKLLSWMTFGNYNIGRNNGIILVQDRLTGRLMEEKIPSYIRFSIRILHQYSSKETARMLKHLFATMTVKQGRSYDSPRSANNIADFVKYHNIPLEEVERPITSFKTFNDFFYRKLKANARLLHSPHDPYVICSPADSRLHCFPSVGEGTRLWIKGSSFSISNLLASDKIASMFPAKSGVCIARLAPQDYHRFHSPVDGRIVRSYHIPGSYYTVNPMAVRQKLDVYTENARTVIMIDSPQHGLVAYVAVGAMMVGSIVMTRCSVDGYVDDDDDADDVNGNITSTVNTTNKSNKSTYPIRPDIKEGQVKISPDHKADPNVVRMDEMGYFAFGGSTIVMLFQPGTKFDSDLLANSRDQLETLIKVGDRIGLKNK